MVNQTYIDNYKKEHASEGGNMTGGSASQTCGHLKDNAFDENGTLIDTGSSEAPGEFNWDPIEQGVILGMIRHTTNL